MRRAAPSLIHQRLHGQLCFLVSIAICTLATLVCVSSSAAQLTESAPAANTPIHIRVSRPASPRTLPGSLFGSFLEPIGHSTYGGLWADVVENPSFEEGLWSAGNMESMLRERPELRRASELGIPLPWEPLDAAQGSRYAPVRGNAANSSQSLLIMSLPGKEVGILQRIYLPVQRELTYNGSVWIKHVRGPATIALSLRRHAQRDQTLAATTVNATSPAWTRYPFSLTLKPNQVAPLEPADLVLSLSDDARAQVDNVSLLPADAIDGMDPDVIAMARDLHSPLIRFGGNFTSAYHWQDGIGPAEKRVSTINLSWGIPEYNTFGTDEFLRFCELIHAQPQIALNLGTGTAEEAAGWVEYVDKRWASHNGGSAGGSLWELGNELWGDFQVGYPGPQRIAAVTLSTSQAVRGVDPQARLIATGGDEDGFHDWNAQQLSNPAGTFNYLSTHFVVGDRVLLPHANSDFRSMAALALPWGLAERMHAIKQQAVEAGHKDISIAFTEWLMISDSHTAPNYSNMGGALFAAGFLNMVMRNSDVVSISDMTGILEFGGIWKKRAQVYGSPAYWVLRQYASSHPHLLFDIDTNSPTYSISRGNNRLPEIQNVPYLDVIGAESEDGSTLLLLCVNRHLTRPLTANIEFSSLPISGGSAKITTISGESILSENDEEDPNRVAAVTRTQSMKGPFLYTFPNASVTVMEIPLQK